MRSQLNLNDDIWSEVLGRVSGLDVLRCRRVCKQMNRITRERFVWLKVYQNAAHPLPTLDFESASALEIERVIIRAETVDKHWMNTRPGIPKEATLLDLSATPAGEPFWAKNVGMHGPYVVYLRMARDRDLCFLWYMIAGLEESAVIPPNLQPAFKYDVPRPPLDTSFPNGSGVHKGISYLFNHATGILRIARVPSEKSHAVVISIDPGRNFQPHIVKYPTSLWKTGFGFEGIKLVGDYLFCCRHPREQLHPVELIHLSTGKRLRVQLHCLSAGFSGNPADYRIQFAASAHYFIQSYDGFGIDVFKLPDVSEWASEPASLHTLISSEPAGEAPPLLPVYSGNLTKRFASVWIFSPTPASIVILGRENINDKNQDFTLMCLETAKSQLRTIGGCIRIQGTVTRYRGNPTLIYAPSARCAVGMVVPIVDTTGQNRSAASKRVHQKLNYLALSLDGGEPRLTVQVLDLPTRLRGSSRAYFLEGVNVHDGRIVLVPEPNRHRANTIAPGGTKICVMDNP